MKNITSGYDEEPDIPISIQFVTVCKQFLSRSKFGLEFKSIIKQL